MAHTSQTKSLKIGPKSGRVMVTGGEDKKVNLWAIGKSEPILVRVLLLLLGRGSHVIIDLELESAWPCECRGFRQHGLGRGAGCGWEQQWANQAVGPRAGQG